MTFSDEAYRIAFEDYTSSADETPEVCRVMTDDEWEENVENWEPFDGYGTDYVRQSIESLSARIEAALNAASSGVIK